MSAPPPKSVTTIGGAMIDTIAIIESDRIERMSMNNADKAFLLLEEGRKTEATLISTHPGGGAVNAAVAFARLGCVVSTIIKIGKDGRGETIEAALKAENVGGEFIIRTPYAATGASVLISSHERNAAIFTFRGANGLIVAEDVPPAAYARDIVYVASLSDRSADVFPFVVEQASGRGAFVAANPGIRQLAARGEAFQNALPKLNVLSMNRDEAAALVPTLNARLHRSPSRTTIPDNPPELMRRGLSAGGFDMALLQFLGMVVDLGVDSVVVTDGHNGSYAANKKEAIFCPALPVDIVGTAGAGDAFSATFCAYMASGSNLGDALKYASINASSVVTFADAQSGLLKRDMLNTEKARKDADLSLRSWPLNLGA